MRLHDGVQITVKPEALGGASLAELRQVREAAHKAEIDAIKANASKDLDESTVKVTDMLTLVKTLMKDKGIESAKVDEEGSGTDATAVNLRNRLMSLTSDLQEQSTRWKEATCRESRLS